MTTREIYFKNLVFCDLPMGLIGYTYRDKDGYFIPIENQTQFN